MCREVLATRQTCTKKLHGTFFFLFALPFALLFQHVLSGPSVRTFALKLPFLIEYSPEPLASCAAVFQTELSVQNEGTIDAVF